LVEKYCLREVKFIVICYFLQEIVQHLYCFGVIVLQKGLLHRGLLKLNDTIISFVWTVRGFFALFILKEEALETALTEYGLT
jgi:hypothetical protein